MLAEDYPVTMLCDMRGCARSSYYHRSTEAAEEAAFQEGVKAVVAEWPTYGVRGWHLSRTLDHTLTLTALQRALDRYPAPEIHHSDLGVQYAAIAYTTALQQVQAQISMAEVGEAWQNGYAERVIRTIKEEEVDLADYRDYHDAYRQLGRFLDDVYMRKRIHSLLGYLAPSEFEEQWRKEQLSLVEMN